MFEARFLGKFEVQLDGTPVQINSRSSQSLLAYLAIHSGTAFRREMLAGMLWPESVESSARSNLRGALWRIRKSFEDVSAEHREALIADDLTIAFDGQINLRLDVHRLTRRLNASPTADELSEIVSLYEGELLPGFYDDWVVMERERLQAIFEQRIGLLVESLLGAQEWSAVLGWAERWINLGGAPEPAYRSLMIAHAAQGDYSGLSAAYTRCEQAMRRELGLDPSETTHHLYEQLQAGDQVNPAAAFQLAERLRESPILQDGGALTKEVDEAPSPGIPPYKGLSHYEAADADMFFGREQSIQELQSRLLEGSSIVIVGASGSGKSSLVRAGLIPALSKQNVEPIDKSKDQDRWKVILLEPSAEPLDSLASLVPDDSELVAEARDAFRKDPSHLDRLLSKKYGSKSHILLVVDQFEELFTLSRDSSEQQAFVDNLMASAEKEEIRVLITLRADFYSHCAEFPKLRRMLSSSQVYIGRMDAEELRQVIEGPAARGNWKFEPSLVELILRDVIRQPGALPHLSHALLETWRRRKSRTLTLEGYAQAGGVRGAIARTAEKVFNVELSVDQQQIAKQILLRLTEIGEGTQATRRRARLAELVPDEEQEPMVSEVLKILADARLITTEEETVEVAHEALISEWPTMRRWIEQDRDGLRIHRHLTESAQAWNELERDPSELYRGTRLGQALEWAEEHEAELNPLEKTYLAASKERSEQLERDREAQQQRELQAATDLAEAQRQRAETERQMAEDQRKAFAQLRRRAVYLSVALVIAVAMAATALFLGERVRQIAITAQTNAEIAQQERLIAFSRELAAAATSSRDQDPERSILLAIAAVSEVMEAGLPIPREAEESLRSSVLSSRLRSSIAGGFGVDFSPDGSRLAASSLGSTAETRDLESGKVLAKFSGHSRDIYGVDVQFSPDETRLLTASADGTARIWDATDGTELLVLQGHNSGVIWATYSPDGSQVATTGADGTVRIWDAESGQQLRLIQQPNAAHAAFSPDGRHLAIAIDLEGSENLRVLNSKTGQEQFAVDAHGLGTEAVVFSHSGNRLFSGGTDGMIRQWDASTGEELLTLFNDAPIRSLALSHEGALLAAGSTDGVARVWDLEAEDVLFEFAGHDDVVSKVAFSFDDRILATSGLDRMTLTWDISQAGEREWLTLAGHDHVVFSADYSADGKRIATSSWDHSVIIWDADSGKVLLRLSDFSGEVARAVFSPDAELLATGDYSGTVMLWDVDSGAPIYAFDAHTPGDIDVGFSPDGRLLASGGSDGTVILWDVQDGRRISELAGHTDVVIRLAFSRDGALLATASWDDTARIWDVSSGRELLNLSGVPGDVKNVEFSPDGSLLATAHDDETARIWQISASEEGLSARELSTLVGHGSTVWDASFSADGTKVATISFDGSVRLWDVESGSELLEWSGDYNGPDVEFSPDGKYLATTSGNGNVYIFVLEVSDLVDLAKSRVSRTLTLEECRKYLHMENCPTEDR